MFEREQKKMTKIHLVKLITKVSNKGASYKIDTQDTLILAKKQAEKKINTIVSGQSLIIMLTDSKVKSTRLKARFLTLIIAFKNEDSKQVPSFVLKNEWLGDLEEQKQPESKPPIKKAKYACLQAKSNEDFFVYLGYGSDCAVFNPKFDPAFLSYLPNVAQQIQEEEYKLVKDEIDAQIENDVRAGLYDGIYQPDAPQPSPREIRPDEPLVSPP